MIFSTAGNSAGATRACSGSAGSRSALAAPNSRSRWSRSAGRRPTRCSSRAPISRSLASSSADWPASSLTVTACRQVAHGSLQASTRKVHSAGLVGHHRAGEPVGADPDRGHPDVLGGAAAAHLLPDDVGGDGVVPLAPDRGLDRHDLADDGLARMASVTHRGGHVVDTQPAGHRLTPHCAAREPQKLPSRRRPVGHRVRPAADSSPNGRRGTADSDARSERPRPVHGVMSELECPMGRPRLDRSRDPFRIVSRVRALRRFTVRAQLPAPLAPLQTLATNLRWSWHPPTLDLFAGLDPAAWERSGHDPVRLLGEISSARFDELAKDADTVVTVTELADDLRGLPERAALVPERARGRPVAAGGDRLLLDGVRRLRGAAQLLRRPRRAGRRPPQGRLRPRAAADRRRAAVPVGLLPAVAVPGRLAAGAVPGARPAGAAAAAALRPGRRAGARRGRRCPAGGR